MPIDLDDIFRAHEREVFAYFLRLLGNRQDAEELAQETFVRACGASLRFRGDSSVRTWLFGIARRVFLETIRARGVERPTELEDRPAEAAASGPDERLDLERALGSLGHADREAVVMVDMLGFEPIEVAGMVGVSPETFRVRLHRARGRLREAYGR
jgi:RNA polymerase sigma-70 factor (ECF subfamily)